MSVHVPEIRFPKGKAGGAFGCGSMIPETPTNYAVQIGLPELDTAISRRHPHMITLVGPTGSGKTAFAVQATAEAASKGKKVLFVSTETPQDEFTLRFLCVSTGTLFEKISNGICWEKKVEPMIPSLKVYGQQGAFDLLAALRCLEEHVEFLFLPGYDRGLPEVNDLLISREFDLCIFDWLGRNNISQTANDLSETETTLSWLSKSTSTTTILTAQSAIRADDSCKGQLPDWAPSECRKLGASSDFRISISNDSKDEEQLRNDEIDDVFLREQHLHLHDIGESIPFTRAFEIQRFDDPWTSLYGEPRIFETSEGPEVLKKAQPLEDYIDGEYLEDTRSLAQKAEDVRSQIRTRNGFVK
ncbi:MAG: DnaB-like helicase C-terminal domain-containing protein [Akkermansiaceae bacterium]